MPKRRAVVNDIIFELDGQDTDSDSGGEGNPAPVARARSKRNRGAAVRAAAQRLASIKKAHAVSTDCVEVIDLESSGVIDLDSSDKECDGAKKAKHTLSQTNELQKGEELQNSDKADESVQSSQNDTFIFPDPNIEMNILDSVESDESRENTIAGCENRIAPLTVKFRDKQIAKHCKRELKEFILTLLSTLQRDADVSDSETDLELDIWPEDVSGCAEMDLESQPDETKESKDDSNLFFVDTNPHNENNTMFDIPQYCQSTAVLKDGSAESAPSPRASRSQCCFNCDGDHLLHQCPLPKNYGRINQARKAMAVVRVGRYHVEDEQKFGHLVAGRISGRLRHALGLKRDELPLHIYRMRLFGYPPGWLQEARIQHSGITMFDSEGQEIQDPEEEEGEVCVPGSKDKFDIKKILDYPGFNVPASSRYKEAAHVYGLPPLSERDSKMLMLASLAPNAMQAYKRKKLTLFPSTGNGDSTMQGGTADMELASDEEAEFPLVPPLPDEAPPPAPPLPPPPPPPPEEPPAPPTPESDVSTSEQKSPSGSGRSSPSLTDLEEHKRRLLAALQCDAPDSPDSSCLPSADTQPDTPQSTDASFTLASSTLHINISKEKPQSLPGTPEAHKQYAVSTPNEQQTTPRIGGVKCSEYGTPVVNVASPYVKLPSDDKFAKDICDMINFENLPDSTGTYKKMSALLRKVKDEVTKIQDS